jgi:hypothetical protein
LRESTAAEREAALLKRTYAASTFGGIGDYLRNKRSKLFVLPAVDGSCLSRGAEG